jgi:hypothetical protein
MLGGRHPIATPNAKFGVIEPKRGLFAGAARPPDSRASYPAAMEFLLTAEAFRPSARLGCSTRSCPRTSSWTRTVGAAASPRMHPWPYKPASVLRGPSTTLTRPRDAGAQPEDLPTEDAKEGPKAFRGEARPGLEVEVVVESVDPRSPCLIGVGQRTWRLGTQPRHPSLWPCGKTAGRRSDTNTTAGERGARAHRHGQDRLPPEFPVRRPAAASEFGVDPASACTRGSAALSHNSCGMWRPSRSLGRVRRGW